MTEFLQTNWPHIVGFLSMMVPVAIFAAVTLAFELAYMKRMGMAPFAPVRWDGLYRVERRERRNGEAFYIVTRHCMFGDYFPVDDQMYDTVAAATEAAEDYFQGDVVRTFVS